MATAPTACASRMQTTTTSAARTAWTRRTRSPSTAAPAWSSTARLPTATRSCATRRSATPGSASTSMTTASPPTTPATSTPAATALSWRNFAEVTSAASADVDWQLVDALTQRRFRVDFYTCDGDEGRTHIGSTLTTTDPSGNASGNAVLATAVTPGEFVTATATARRVVGIAHCRSWRTRPPSSLPAWRSSDQLYRPGRSTANRRRGRAQASASCTRVRPRPSCDDARVKAQVPLESWQVGPWNRWAYVHVGEVVDTVARAARWWAGRAARATRRRRRRAGRPAVGDGVRRRAGRGSTTAGSWPSATAAR